MSILLLVSDLVVLRVENRDEVGNSKLFVPAFTGRVSVMVCGCIGSCTVGNLIRSEQSVNSDYYIKFLEENLTESARKIYVNQGWI